MTTEPSTSKTLIVTAWTFLLLASGLPRIILQEVLGYQVSFNLASVIAAVVISIGLILTLIWNEGPRFMTILSSVPGAGGN